MFFMFDNRLDAYSDTVDTQPAKSSATVVDSAPPVKSSSTSSSKVNVSLGKSPAKTANQPKSIKKIDLGILIQFCISHFNFTYALLIYFVS